MNRINKCLSEETEEINQIETEAANDSFMDLPWIPGKSLVLQAIEAGLKEGGWKRQRSLFHPSITE
jgi:hypothetical protein